MTAQLAAYHRNGQPVAPKDFYAIACDPRRSVAVEACAGAGKTWILVSRIVRALLDSSGSGDAPLRPQDILAITFTKKAAGEMRERLNKLLQGFATADALTLQRELEMRGVRFDTSTAEGRQVLEDSVKQLSRLYRDMLTSGRSVQVRTFHSWFAALLRSAPVAVLRQLQLPLNYELLEDDTPAKALVWRRFYAAVLGDTALHHDFEAVALAHGRSQTHKALESALDKRTEFALADAVGVVDSSVRSFGQQFPHFADLSAPESAFTLPADRAQLLAAAGALGRASAKTHVAKGVELEQAVTSSNWQGVVSALLTNTGTARQFSDKMLGIEDVRQAQRWVLEVVEACLQRDAWEYQQRMARLSRVLIDQFAALKREHGWVDMNDVERAASVMLADPVLSGWVQERLDVRIKHLMIDEFQDTNPLQWQALSSWLSAYGGAGGGSAAPSVFLVGDPKQSIYRFRRAEPQVFEAAQAFVVGALGGDVLACDHTWRNSKEVIGTVNRVMEAAAATDGYGGFRRHTTDSKQVGQVGRLPPIARARVEVGNKADAAEGAESIESARTAGEADWRDSLTQARELSEDTLRSLEAQQACAWVAHQLALGTPLAEVMVLSRKRAGLVPLKQALQACHIPAQIGEKTDLIDCCEVQDIVALLDVLVSPQHDLSLARALRSPLFGLADEALVQLAVIQRASAGSWFSILEGAHPLSPVLQNVHPILRRWKGWLNELPPHDALQAIYDDGDVLARFGAAAPPEQRAAVLTNLRALLGVALAWDGGRFATPYRFVRALKAGGTLAPGVLHSDAVRLLTIHGAKGLEAEAVLIIDTDTAPRNADTMTVLIDWPGTSAAPHQFVFLASEKRPPLCAQDVLVKEQAARDREELNALYVAMSRARNQLVISSVEPHVNAPRSWWERLKDALPEIGGLAAPETGGTDPSRGAGTFKLPVLPVLSIVPIFAAAHRDNSADLTTGATSLAPISARLGKAMHRWLEWGLGGETVHSIASHGAALAAVAREFALSPAEAVQATALARRIVEGDGAWAWHPDTVAWEGNEVDLVYQGQALRLDRLVQRKDAAFAGQWWVLDYKSAHAPQDQLALVLKMQTYRAAVQHCYPDSVVKAAFLTGLGTVVEVA